MILTAKQYTAEHFLSQLKPVREAIIELPGSGTLTLEWQRGAMATLSGKPGKKLIIRQLKDILRQADEGPRLPLVQP